MELLLNQEPSSKQILEERLIQTVQKNILKIPIIHISNIIKKSFSLTLSEKEEENLIYLLKDSTFKLKQKELDKLSLLKLFITSYDVFKFLIPELTYHSESEKLNFESEINEIKTKFIETMRHHPYSMEEIENYKKIPIALNLYYRKIDEDFSKEYDYIVTDSTLISAHSTKFEECIYNNQEEKCKNNLITKLNYLNNKLEKKLEKNDFKNIESLQLRTLALGIKIPSLYNLNINSTNVTRKLLKQCEYSFGNFEIPISQYFKKELEKIIFD